MTEREETYLEKISLGELLEMDPEEFDFFLDQDEIFAIFKKDKCCWVFDYERGGEGEPGYHAELKSGNHSDCFFNLKRGLERDFIRKLFASQLSFNYEISHEPGYEKPTMIVGIPTAATGLAKELARMLRLDYTNLYKNEDGRIKISQLGSANIGMSDVILIVEDLRTKGTGVTEAVQAILDAVPFAKFYPNILYIINRGKGDKVVIEHESIDNESNSITLNALSLTDYDANEWAPEECLLCSMGSKPIKPKPPDKPGNWEILVNGQK